MAVTILPTPGLPALVTVECDVCAKALVTSQIGTPLFRFCEKHEAECGEPVKRIPWQRVSPDA